MIQITFIWKWSAAWVLINGDGDLSDHFPRHFMIYVSQLHWIKFTKEKHMLCNNKNIFLNFYRQYLGICT